MTFHNKSIKLILMIKFKDKFYIFLKDITQIIAFRISLKKKGEIIWGRSPYLNYGPGIRTVRLKSQINKFPLNDFYIYMQSHWPWYDILFYTLLGKLFNIKILFNQNGVFTEKYNKNYKFHNLTLLFGLLNSNFIIYQSWFCYESLKKICPKIFKKALEEKNFCRLLNPSIEIKQPKSLIIEKKYRIIICKHFNKDIAYYSKYIYELVTKIYTKKEISEIIIIGDIKRNLNIKELNNLEKIKKIKIFKNLDNNEIINFLSPGTIAIHLNYGDPCPNFISEAISSGVPCIVNDVGGAKEIAMEASVSSKNEINMDGFLMPKPVNVIKNIEKIIFNYEKFQKYAEIRAKKLSLKKYVEEHLFIFKTI